MKGLNEFQPMYHCFSILLFLICLFSSCADSTPSAANPGILLTLPSESVNRILVFKQEKALEIWKGTQLVAEKLPFSTTSDLPVGLFPLDSFTNARQLFFTFPNIYYRTKQANTSTNYTTQWIAPGIHNIELIQTEYMKNDSLLQSTDWELAIFPNDGRADQKLLPCYRCPYWMAELYSFMELVLLPYQYPISNPSTQ